MKTVRKLNLKPKKFKIPRPKETKDSHLFTNPPGGGLVIDYDALNNQSSKLRRR
jgi:hypothetical protein